jgi:hypothetical protein
MRKLFAACTLAAGIAVVAPVCIVYAHHSAAAEYDVERVVQFKGVLTKVEWINPHSHMSFDVKGPDGKIANWSIEFAGVSGLRRAGLANKQALTIGQTYGLAINPSRDGRKAGLINTLTFPDGRVFRLGTGAEEQQR